MTAAFLGGFPFNNQGGDRLVSKVVTSAIAALFQRTDKLDAQVRAEPVAKLLQGSVDGFDLIGSGLRMYNGLRLEALELYLQAVAIDIGAILRGQVKLQRPTQAMMRVVLTANDLTSSFNTPFVVDKLKRLTFDGQSLDFRNTVVSITAEKALRLQTEVNVGGSGWVDLGWTSEIIAEGQHKIQFVNVEYAGDSELEPVGRALVEHVNTLLNLEKFALDGTQLMVDRLRVQADRLVFYGVAKIAHFPKGRARKAIAAVPSYATPQRMAATALKAS